MHTYIKARFLVNGIQMPLEKLVLPQTIDRPRKGDVISDVDGKKYEVKSVEFVEYSSEDCGFIYSLVPHEEVCEPDYWTKLKHQYAGMAMQAFCANPSEHLVAAPKENIALWSVAFANSLVGALKLQEANIDCKE
jgi:hypothetical protein